jgi:hypothetical protein
MRAFIAVSVAGGKPGENLVRANFRIEGRLTEIADEAVLTIDTQFGRVEDAQTIIPHLLAHEFMEPVISVALNGGGKFRLCHASMEVVDPL